MTTSPDFFAPHALAGRVAAVTGGSSGIGLATVNVLLAAGAAVALWETLINTAFGVAAIGTL